MAIRILPRPPDTFVKREDDEKRIIDNFAHRRIFFIEGIEGIGKTTTGLALANNIEEKNQGKVIWVSCQEGWQFDTLIREIMSWLSKADNEAFETWEKDNSSGIKEKFLFLINLLNKEEHLIFIDDFHLLDFKILPEILSILKTYMKNSKFFFISQERPQLSPIEILDIFELKLEGMKPEEGFMLIEKILKSYKLEVIPPTSVLEEAVQKLNGHPLMIKTFAALIIEGLGEPEELINNLPEFIKEMEEQLFSKVLQGLSEKEEELIKLICLSRISIPRELLGDSKNWKGLERRFLLTKDEKGRYLAHSLIRQFIVNELSECDRKSLHGNLAEFFHSFLKKKSQILEFAREALFHYSQKGDSANIIGLLEEYSGFMCSSGYYEEVINAMNSVEITNPRLLITKANVYSILGKWEEAIKLLSQIEKSLKKKDEALLAEVYSSLGGAYLNTGRLGDSLSYYEKALNIFEENKHSTYAIKVMNYMTFIYGFRSQLEKALFWSEKSLKLARESQNEAGLAHGLRMKGVVLLEGSRYDEAIQVSMECLEKAKALGSVRLICWALFNLATAYLELGNIEKVKESIDEIRNISVDSSDTQIKGFYHMAMARYFWEEGQLFEAVEEAGFASDNFKLQGNELGVAISKHLISQILQEKDEERLIGKLLEECLDTAIKTQHFILEIRAREAISFLYLRQGKYEEAEKLINKNLENLNDIKREENICEAHLMLAEIAWRLKDPKKVDASLKTAIQIARENNLYYHLARLLYLSGTISSSSKEIKISHIDEAGKLKEKFAGKKKRLAEIYFMRVDELTKERFLVRTSQGSQILSVEEIEKLKQNKSVFSLFIDLPGRTVWEKDVGDVNILGKRILSSLLIYLIKNSGKPYTSEELFKSVWEFEYEGWVSDGEIRKNISRLRDLIEPDRKTAKYIKLAEGYMKQKGRYFFDDQQSFCLIEKIEDFQK